MVLGGAFLLFILITLNKLIAHYLYPGIASNEVLLGRTEIFPSHTFQINTMAELYFTWFAFTLSLIGFIAILYKLVKTWKP